MSKESKPKLGDLDKIFRKTLQSDSELKKVMHFEKWDSGELELKYGNPSKYYELIEKYWDYRESLELDSDIIESIDILLSILNQNPFLFDPLDDLAHLALELEEFEIGATIYMTYYKIFERLLPKNFDYSINKIPWGILENRPLLRFLECRANFIKNSVGIKEATHCFEEIILLNPNDNQGIRGILATDYLITGNSQKVIDLAKKYPGDLIQELTMGNILALYRLGEIKKAESQLIKIWKYSKHVVKELLETKHKFPKEDNNEFGVAIGGPMEAYIYWEEQGKLWKQTKSALEWLKEVSNKLPK